MKRKRRLLLSMLFVVLMTSILAVPIFAKPKLNKKEHTIIAGKSIQLKVKGTKKKPTWTSSNKKVATVSKKGLVKALKAGEVTIKAKVDGKTLKCKMVVFDPASDSPVPPPNFSVSTGKNSQQTVLNFNQDAWYIARLEVQIWDKEKQSFSWTYSDSCAKGQKAKVTVDTSKYEVSRVGFQVWFFGWDNFYFNLPYADTGYAKTYTLTGYGDYPEFTWN